MSLNLEAMDKQAIDNNSTIQYFHGWKLTKLWKYMKIKKSRNGEKQIPPLSHTYIHVYHIAYITVIHRYEAIKVVCSIKNSSKGEVQAASRLENTNSRRQLDQQRKG